MSGMDDPGRPKREPGETADVGAEAERMDDLPSLGDLLFEQRTPPPSDPTPLPTVRLPRPASFDPADRTMKEARPRALSPRRFRTLAAVAEAIVPRGGEIPHSASDVGVPERLDALLAGLDPSARKLLDRSLRAWEWSTVFSRSLRPFSRLSPAARAAATERARKSRIPIKGQILQALKHYCLNTWASTPPVEEALGYTYSCLAAEPPRDGPPLEVVSWPEVSRDHTETCDAVVIGSGAGGAVMAKELAEAGLSVVVLEEGGYYTRKDFTGPPWHRLLRFYRAGGTTIALGNPAIPIPMGKAVGGTTLVNSGTCFRTPPRVLDRWGNEFGIEGIDAEAMRPLFDRVEKVLRVKPVPEELLGRNATTFRRGVTRLGLHGEPIRRDIEGCRGCGVCAFGCPSDAKQATHISYLPRAQRHGATIFAHARAERILVEGGRAAGVVASLLDPGSGEPRVTLTVHARIVVVSAGAVHTPALLGANALGNRSGQLGRNLRIHPAAGIGAFFAEEINSWRGTLQPFYVDDWHAEDIMIEVTSTIPSIAAGTAPGVGLYAKDFVARLPHLASAGLFVSDTSSGRVIRRRSGEPTIIYRLNRTDARKLARGMARVCEIFLAAGAKSVMTGLPSIPAVSKKEDVERLASGDVARSALKLTAFHPVGTARMGVDPARSVVDPWGEVHGVPGLFVADGSMLPGCPTVNPMVTIMAFATRTAEHLIAARASSL